MSEAFFGYGLKYIKNYENLLIWKHKYIVFFFFNYYFYSHLLIVQNCSFPVGSCGTRSSLILNFNSLNGRAVEVFSGCLQNLGSFNGLSCGSSGEKVSLPNIRLSKEFVREEAFGEVWVKLTTEGQDMSNLKRKTKLVIGKKKLIIF